MEENKAASEEGVRERCMSRRVEKAEQITRGRAAEGR